MTPIIVPDTDRPTLQWLAKAPPELVQQLAAAIGAAAVPQRTSLAARLGEVRLPEGGPGAQQITDALLGVNSFRFSHGQTVEETVEGLARSQSLSLGDEERVRLREHMAALLHQRPLEVVAKAIDLRSEQDRLFHLSRIYTDARPVYGDDADLDPVGYVSFHILKIDHYEDGDYRSFRVALDDEDLDNLRDSVDRAVRKRGSLHRYMQERHIPLIDVEVD
ncbi:hypothetical protein [Blastococcus montanus]|uniref:hypothetical protein n=1 Tax=Blastococcus montanus TaxID=3144973 RepID=UPI003208CA0B